MSTTYTFLLVIAAVLTSPSLGARDGEPQQVKLVRNDPTKSVAMLNRHNFKVSVEQEHVDDWIVLSCVDWMPVCQGLWQHYRNSAAHWEQALSYSASSWQSTAVRFAEVDCATDKALCNEMSIEYYPTVQHYKGGKLVDKWEIYESMMKEGIASVSKHLSSWISKELKDKLSGVTAKKASSADPSIVSHMRELTKLLSLRGMMEDPATAAVGYLILVAAVVLFAWIVGTGLELEFASTLSYFSKEGKAALLPKLPEMAAPRTIVRTSFEL